MYSIDPKYRQRQSALHFDDTPFQDQWQNEVYAHARSLADEYDLKNVVDYGCGSGYKLLKYFNEFTTVGVDVEQTVEWLCKKYPMHEPWNLGHIWTTSQEPIRCDLLIAADVIEHLPDPDSILNYIEVCKPKFAVISTPFRRDEDQGPPSNQSHFREWTMSEFNEYIGSRFKIAEHFVSNEGQRTQVIIASVVE